MRGHANARVYVEEHDTADDAEHTVKVRRLGGEAVGDIGCRPTDSIWELKAKLERSFGLDAETLALYQPSANKPLGEHESVGSCHGLPAELYAVTLRKVEICTIAGVDASKLTDAQLELACSSPEAEGDIIILKGCRQLRNLSCLHKLDQMQVQHPA